MSAPVVADLRKPMKLDCRFDMEGEELNSVKWYKDEREFFRYVDVNKLFTSRSFCEISYYTTNSTRKNGISC